MHICGKHYTTIEEAVKEREEIKEQSQQITEQLAELKLQGKGAFANKEFKKNRQALVYQNQLLQKKLTVYNKAIKESRKGKDVSGVAMEVRRLIEKYDKFAQDRTRVSSMRIMASEIAGELRGALSKSKLVELDV